MVWQLCNGHCRVHLERRHWRHPSLPHLGHRRCRPVAEALHIPMHSLVSADPLAPGERRHGAEVCAKVHRSCPVKGRQVAVARAAADRRRLRVPLLRCVDVEHCRALRPAEPLVDVRRVVLRPNVLHVHADLAKRMRAVHKGLAAEIVCKGSELLDGENDACGAGDVAEESNAECAVAVLLVHRAHGVHYVRGARKGEHNGHLHDLYARVHLGDDRQQLPEGAVHRAQVQNAVARHQLHGAKDSIDGGGGVDDHRNALLVSV
mmetsp:Transcript_1313/g.4721  ORF Transcript_1313/g.4721 Transcript_1313/m.4721 type:complete len:262 (+) Transcript_1313:360-1145(+)